MLDDNVASDYPSNETNVTSISEFIDNDFFAEAIREQIEDSLDSNSVHYLNDIEAKYEEVKEKFQEADYEDLTIFMQSLYGNILNWIMDRYQVEIHADSENMQEAAQKLYQFFVIDLKSVTTAFMINYINENCESIINNIDSDRLNKGIFERIKTDVIECHYIAATNLEEVLIQVGGMTIEFGTFIQYAMMTGELEIDLSHFATIEFNDDSDPEEQTLALWSMDDSQDYLASTIISQITAGEYDRNMVLDISDRLMELWDIRNHIEEKGIKVQPISE